MNLKPYITTPDNAERIADWLRNQGGIAIWRSIDFNRPRQTLTTPVNTAEEHPHAKPAHWVGSAPACIITDFADVLVSKYVEVKRLNISLRRGGNGIPIKCTDASSKRVRAAVAKAGEGAYYELDCESQQAIILKPESQMLLLDYLQAEKPNETLGQRLKRLSQEGDPSASVRFVKGSNLGPITIFSTAPSAPPTSEPLPYRNQEAMEACMKRNPGLTEEKYKALAEFHGF